MILSEFEYHFRASNQKAHKFCDLSFIVKSEGVTYTLKVVLSPKRC